MKFAGVVVLYNPDSQIYNNIKSYLPELDVLYVVDNTPNQNIKDKFTDKKIIYIPLNENKGIAYALNVGAREAIKFKANWLLTMDQDSKFENNGLKKMKEFIYQVKGNDYFKYLLGTSFNKLGIVSPFHRTTRTQLEEPTGIDRPLQVMTSGNLVNLNAYEKVGGFKDWMFIDCVDFEFCLNLRKNNYEIIQLNFVNLNHELGDTIEKNFLNKTVYADNHSALRRYYIVRNRHYLNDMYKNIFPLYCGYEIARTKKELLKVWLFENEKVKKTLYMYRGYRDYKKGIKGKINV